MTDNTTAAHAGSLKIRVTHDGSCHEPMWGTRQQYTYVLTDGNGREYVANDLRSGVSADVDVRDALRALMSYLGAAAESYAYVIAGGESVDTELFPEWLMEQCYLNSSEIDMLMIELEGWGAA